VAPEPEVLLAHPGGPYWESRHAGAWSIPKGGRDSAETLLEAALREFREETGFDPAGPFHELGRITQRSGKVVWAWAFEGDCDPTRAISITTTTEWPPRSGRFIEVPEVDRVAFFSIDEQASRSMPVRPDCLIGWWTCCGGYDLGTVQK